MKNPFFWSRASNNNQWSMWWIMRSSMRLQVAQSLPCTTLCSGLNVCSGDVSRVDKSTGWGRVSIRCQQQKSVFLVILGCPVHVAHDLEVYSRFVSGWGKAEALMSKYYSLGLCVSMRYCCYMAKLHSDSFNRLLKLKKIMTIHLRDWQTQNSLCKRNTSYIIR